jgi:two-component system chemotaxis sensor kinase CheA
VQVPVRKLDALLNLVGELLIEKDTIISKYTDLGFNNSDFTRLHRITSDLQYGVMGIRLVQVGFLFSKFHRVLRDVAGIENKKVELKLEGTENEIDRNILKIITDALVHMVRNSVSHGIESPEKRLALGKPESGTVTLSARNEKDTVFIDILDDGAGIDLDVIKKKALEKEMISEKFASSMSDNDILMLLFEPGFSSAEVITEVSGRGVGMDVVKKVTESIGGTVSVTTELGKGSVFTMALPSSMAVKGALLFELDKQEFAIPLSYTEAVLALKKQEIHKVNSGLVATYLGRPISVMFLKDIYEKGHLKGETTENIFHNTFDNVDENIKLDMVVVSYSGNFVGLVVDKLVQQKEIVEKGMTNPVDNNSLFSGATILGNGNVCLVLDIASILSNLYKEKVRS